MLELIEISGTRSANNARLSEYVLWKNRYAQGAPVFEVEYIREVRRQARTLIRKASKTSRRKQSAHRIKDQVFDQREKADDKRLASLDQLSWCEDKSTSLASYRRKGPSCIHPSEATSQIASDCKAKNDIWSSAAAYRERRPQVS